MGGGRGADRRRFHFHLMFAFIFQIDIFLDFDSWFNFQEYIMLIQVAGGARRRDGRPLSKDDFFAIPGRDPHPCARRGILQTTWATWNEKGNRPRTVSHGDVPDFEIDLGEPGICSDVQLQVVSNVSHQKAMLDSENRRVHDEPVRDEQRGDEPVGDHSVGDEPVQDEPGDETVGDEQKVRSDNRGHVSSDSTNDRISVDLCNASEPICVASPSTRATISAPCFRERRLSSDTVTAPSVRDSISASEQEDDDNDDHYGGQGACAPALSSPPRSAPVMSPPAMSPPAMSPPAMSPPAMSPPAITDQNFPNVAYDDVFLDDSPSTGSIYSPPVMHDLQEEADCSWSNIAAAILGQDPRKPSDRGAMVELTEMCTQDRSGVIRYVPIIISQGLNEDTQTITPLARPKTSTPHLSRRERFEQKMTKSTGGGGDNSKPNGSKKSASKQSKSAPPPDESRTRSLRKRDSTKKYN